MSDQNVKRTMGYWEQFFKGDKKQAMLLKMVMQEKKLDVQAKMTYEEISSAMNLVGNRCLHDTDRCLHNTRRDM